MAAAAARQALEGLDVSLVGAVVVSTITPDYLTPSLACLLQRELGLSEEIAAMDINCACAGYVMALKTAHALLSDMPGRIALVVGCEMLSRITDYADRSTCVLFGDGAGAAVIRRDEAGTFEFYCGARGGEEQLSCRAAYLSNSPHVRRLGDGAYGAIQMNGSEVFRFAVEVCVRGVTKTLSDAGKAPSEAEHYIFHQANRRIIDGIVPRLGIEHEKCLINIEKYGNTSSATCAIALDELFRSGKVRPGDGIILSAFGGGLSFATAYFVQNGEV
jgi:3-oxoacyl-[acyl-carrier-protein] synthase-3